MKSWTGRGRIEGRKLILESPLDMPDGTEVEVEISPFEQEAEEKPADDEVPFEKLPFFGMHADLRGVVDGAEGVRKEREKWQDRLTRRD